MWPVGRRALLLSRLEEAVEFFIEHQDDLGALVVDYFVGFLIPQNWEHVEALELRLSLLIELSHRAAAQDWITAVDRAIFPTIDIKQPSLCPL